MKKDVATIIFATVLVLLPLLTLFSAQANKAAVPTTHRQMAALDLLLFLDR